MYRYLYKNKCVKILVRILIYWYIVLFGLNEFVLLNLIYFQGNLFSTLLNLFTFINQVITSTYNVTG